MTISIQIDDKQVQRMLKAISNKPKITKLLNQGTNRGLSMAKTELSKATREQVNLAAKKVNEKIIIHKAINARNGYLRVKARGLQLSNYGPKHRGMRPLNDPEYKRVKRSKRPRGGVSVKVKKRGKRAYMPGAFITKLPNGANAIAIRGSKGIEVLHGPSVYQVLKNDTVDRVLPIIGRRYVKEVARLYERLL